MADETYSVHLHSVARMLRSIVDDFGDHVVGARLGAGLNPTETGAFGLRFLHATDLVEAFDFVSRSIGSFQQATSLEFSRNGPRALLKLALKDAKLDGEHQLVEAWLVFLAKSTREFQRSERNPVRVFLRGAPNGRGEAIRGLLNCDVVFGRDFDGLELDLTNSRRVQGKYDQSLQDVLERHLISTSRNWPNWQSFDDILRDGMADALRAGEPSISWVSKRIGMSVRTMQRRLASEHLEFSRLMDETRATLAKSLLAEGEFSVSEIAHLCGYSDVPSFSRAFKRWTQTTPSMYRRSTN